MQYRKYHYVNIRDLPIQETSSVASHFSIFHSVRRPTYTIRYRSESAIMNLILSVLTVALILSSLDKVTALYCYSCEGQTLNWKCNENEPVKCRSWENVCVSMGDSFISKRCASGCPVSRGDQQTPTVCSKCSSNFCNNEVAKESREPPPPSTNAPQHDAFYGNGARYILYAKTLTFWEARASCVQEGGVLANIHSSEIQDFIVKSILNDSHAEGIMEVTPFPHYDLYGIWIGLYRTEINQTGNFSWIWTDDGSVIADHSKLCVTSANASFKNWEAKASVNDIQFCGHLSRQGKWKYDSCGKRLPWFLCEYPADGVVKQSAIINGMIYTYKFRFVRPGTGTSNITCNENMKEAAVSDLLLEKFGFMSGVVPNIGSRWCDDTVGDTPVMNESTTDCNRTYQFIICNRPAQITECSRNDGIQDNERVPPDEENNNPDVCDPYTHHDRETNFNFGSVAIAHYAASQETCPNGRPIAIMWCNRDQTFVDFDTIPCDTSLVDALSEIRNASHDEPLEVSLAEIQKLNFLSLHQSATVPPQYLIYVEEALKSLLNNSKARSKALPYIAKITSDLQKHIGRQYPTRHITNSTQLVDESKKLLVELLESSAAAMEIAANDSRAEFSADEVTVEVVLLAEGTSYDGSIAHESKDNLQIRVFPETSTLHSKSTSNIRVVFAVYNGDQLFPSHDENLHIESVVSATVTDGVRTYSVPVEFSFQTTNTNFSEGVCQRRECRYYDESAEKWKKDGCRKTSESNDGWGVHTVTCTCDHTTSFAVVVSQQNQQNHALDIASTIGLIACVVCLTLTIILFFTTPDLKRIRCGFIHIHLCICLDVSYLVFLIGIEQTSNRYACLTTAVLIHFFLVASWGWMGVESLTMYRMFVHPLSKKSITEKQKVAYGVYMISAAIVLLTLSFSVLAQYQGWGDGESCTEDYWSSYISDGYCWLQGRSLYFGFLAIAFVTLILNSISAALIIKAITWRKADVPNRPDDRPQVHIIRALLIAMLLGLAWIFAVPLAVSENQTVQNVFGWLFAVTTSFQGVFIFYFFCIRRKDVRSAWTRPIRNTFKSKRKSSITESGIGLRGARTESFLYLPNTTRNMHSASEKTQQTAT